MPVGVQAPRFAPISQTSLEIRPNLDANYKVHVTPDRAVIKVFGKASYLNAEPLRSFFQELEHDGQKRFVFDFQECSSMDSTFLGILVSVTLKLRKNAEGGSVVLLNLRGRNLETVCNLGIHQIAEINSDEIKDPAHLENLLSNADRSSVNSQTIYAAHKALMSLNEKNLKVFSDVVSYLEQKSDD